MIDIYEGRDVSELLGVVKWEAPLPACLVGQAKGLFPSFIKKTDSERIQNLVIEYDQYKKDSPLFEVTEKLDGTSFTCSFNNGQLDVCSRNLSLKDTTSNVYWDMVKRYELASKLEALGRNIAIQGECIGEGIQKNQYALKGVDLYVFNIFNIDTFSYVSASERLELLDYLGLKGVPVVNSNFDISNLSVSDVLEFANGKSLINGSPREGLVFKSLTMPDLNFKAISNLWLLKD